MQQRDIRFRAWDKWNKCFVYINVGNPSTADTEALGIFANVEKQQYTGLKDKNGKEIYEGDVVQYKYLSGFACEDDYPNGGDIGKSEVKFRNGEFWPREYYREVEDGYYSSRYWDLEIIGNVWENPKLLSN